MYHESFPEDMELEQQAKRPLLTGARIAVAAAALTVLGLCAYAIYEHGVAVDTMGQNAATAASLKNATDKIEQLRAELSVLSELEQQPAQPSAPSKDKSVQKQKPKAGSPARPRSATSRATDNDPRWNQVQSQLNENGKAIAATQQDLSSTRAELRDSIARTHEELAELERKGERRYYEFDILKGKKFSSAGSMNIKLRKSNYKRHYADLDLLVDDRVLTKKHVNLYEPAMFYTGSSQQPIQVVINSIGRDHIHGYVSEPKYGKAELASMPAANALQGTTQTPAQESSAKLQERLTSASK